MAASAPVPGMKRALSNDIKHQLGSAGESEIISKEAQVQFVKFVFKEEGTSPVYAIFEDKEECKIFVEKVKLIAKACWP